MKSEFKETEDFWKTEEGIKALYWFDAFFKFRHAKSCIKQNYFWGWEALHEFFEYRKKFHNDINNLKQQ